MSPKFLTNTVIHVHIENSVLLTSVIKMNLLFLIALKLTTYEIEMLLKNLGRSEKRKLYDFLYTSYFFNY